MKLNGELTTTKAESCQTHTHTKNNNNKSERITFTSTIYDEILMSTRHHMDFYETLRQLFPHTVFVSRDNLSHRDQPVYLFGNFYQLRLFVIVWPQGLIQYSKRKETDSMCVWVFTNWNLKAVLFYIFGAYSPISVCDVCKKFRLLCKYSRTVG